MTWLLDAAWLAVAVPFGLALLVVAVGRRSRLLGVAVAAVGPVLVVCLGLAALFAAPTSGPVVEPWTSGLAAHGSVTWFAVGSRAIAVGWSVDSLAAVMLLVVGVVAFTVMVFSAGYMRGERGWSRYFALLSVFTGSMTLLVIGDSFVSLFMGWELVGACSYLLIGFWYERPAAAAAAVKAFIVTRIGDVGLLLGIALLAVSAGSLSYTTVVARLGSMPAAAITVAAILLATGAIGKSAQFPLHIWLPDAMEGPTPVSALIHAATMVAAGVYLVARVWPIFAAAPAARSVLLVVGVVSALGAALIALPQRDIKKVLAYSTISQLGFMFAALGVGAWGAAFFHLVAHAAFKALLFLAAGSTIHGSGTQDLPEMGGLRRSMPVTFVTWLVGAGALVGLPPLAGFFSKDAILDAVWVHNPAAGAALLAATALTGFYTFRATRLAFFGEARGEVRAHESPMSMLVPLVALAIPTALLGVAGAWIAEKLGQPVESLSLPISGLAVGLALAGGAIGWRSARDPRAETMARGERTGVWGLVRTGFGYDAAIERFVVRPTLGGCRVLWAGVDRFLIDGSVEGVAAATKALGGVVSRAQGGDGQGYAGFMALSVVVMLATLVILGRWLG